MDEYNPNNPDGGAKMKSDDAENQRQGALIGGVRHPTDVDLRIIAFERSIDSFGQRGIFTPDEIIKAARIFEAYLRGGDNA